MTNANDIDEWVAPNWHPDWGDPQAELDMFKEFCKRLIEMRQGFAARLVCIEEGYMNVDLLLVDTKIGELWAVKQSGALAYGLFYQSQAGEEEHYFTRIDDGISLLTVEELAPWNSP